jgi:Cdc6-like AAA superfamily ATPase
VIILEGPDGAGKTHLAKRLAEEFGLEYKRYSGLSSTTGPDGAGIVDWWDEQIAENGHDVVYDRCFYISEPIYQLATPHRDLIAEPQRMQYGIQRLANFSPLIIFCIPPFNTALGNVGQRDRLEGVDDKALAKIHWAYHVAFGYWSEILYHTCMHWDYTWHDPAEITERVTRYMRRGGGS